MDGWWPEEMEREFRIVKHKMTVISQVAERKIFDS
jgi:hypothetical protein